MYTAMGYAISNSIETESGYPYKGRNGNCAHVESSGKGVVKATSRARVQANSVTALKTAIAAGPVSVGIEADTRVFQGYTGGILNSAACGTNLDHGVLAVGYGTQSGQDYYIVKNSWGASWGEKGYIRIAAVNG
jgi:C1A family cysteine protease